MKSLKFIKYFIIFISIAVFILLFSFAGLLNPVEGVLNSIISPIVSFFNNISSKVSDIGKSAGSVGDLEKENSNLKNKVDELTLEISQLKESKAENESLRKQLGFVGSIKYKTIIASVLTKDPSSFLKVLIIDKGSKDGIKKDMAVVSEGFLLGRVLEVNTSMAKVLLITDSNFQISGITQDSRALGIVKGQIGSGIAMETIPKDKNVKTGDMVITANLETGVPAGLLIGKITDIYTENNGLFQKASISPFASLDDVKNVILVSM